MFSYMLGLIPLVFIDMAPSQSSYPEFSAYTLDSSSLFHFTMIGFFFFSKKYENVCTDTYILKMLYFGVEKWISSL